MPQLVKITMPSDMAQKEARAADRANADSPLFQTKAALASAFGEGKIRPWRLIAADNDIYTVIGWIANAEAIAPTPASRRLGANAEILPWSLPATGERCAFDILATPVKSVKTGPEHSRRHIDVAMQRKPDASYSHPNDEQRTAAWTAWLQAEMSAPRTGMRVETAPTIIEKGWMATKRLIHGDRTAVSLPALRARFEAVIVDAGTLGGFLALGFKKAKDLGLGCLIPVSVLEREGLL
jgi:hypothetical protein